MKSYESIAKIKISLKKMVLFWWEERVGLITPGKVLKEHVQAEWFLISVFLKIQLLQDPFSTLAYLKNVA